jgi:hypothetical protein
MDDKAPIERLSGFAAIYLWLSVVGAVIIWITLAVKREDPTRPLTSPLIPDWTGILLGLGVLLSGIFLYLFIAVLCNIALDIAHISKNGKQ